MLAVAAGFVGRCCVGLLAGGVIPFTFRFRVCWGGLI